MDRRAAMQLRLQETVEGLSVVAISYYAVNLAAQGVRARWPSPPGIEKPTLLALLTVPVVLVVWLMVRRIPQGSRSPGLLEPGGAEALDEEGAVVSWTMGWYFSTQSIDRPGWERRASTRARAAASRSPARPEAAARVRQAVPKSGGAGRRGARSRWPRRSAGP